MTNTQETLAEIGFGTASVDAVYWRTAPVNAPEPCAPALCVTDYGVEPACSATLQRWRALLRRGAGSSPYRISRVKR